MEKAEAGTRKRYRQEVLDKTYIHLSLHLCTVIRVFFSSYVSIHARHLTSGHKIDKRRLLLPTRLAQLIIPAEAFS